MIKPGATKRGGIKLITPVKAGGNTYYLKKYCGICGLMTRNATSSHAVCCKDTGPDITNPAHRSSCQKAHESIRTKLTRAKQKSEGYKRALQLFKLPPKDTSQQGMRTCLRCDENEDGSIPMFLSLSPYHRICEPCSRLQAGFKMEKLSRIGVGSKIEGLEFNHSFND